MYMWFEEMGLIYFPHIKTKEEFKKKFELLMRRLASEQIMSRLAEIQTIDIGGGNEH